MNEMNSMLEAHPGRMEGLSVAEDEDPSVGQQLR
jgi:hypothetical protein